MSYRCINPSSRPHRFSPLKPIFMLLGVALTHLPLAQAFAQSQTPQANPPLYEAPPPPPDQGAPVGRRQGGGSRGDCSNYGALTALMPIRNGSVIGTTQSPEPTFWFYVPSPLTSATTVEFVLQDQRDQYVYQTQLAFNTDSAGLLPISVNQPDTALEAGETYSWTLSLYCNPQRPSASVYVRGLLQKLGTFSELSEASRTNISSQNTSQLNASETALALKQAKADAKKGIWLETITRLAMLRSAKPSNSEVADIWSQLLQQENLEHLDSAIVLPEGNSVKIKPQK